MENNFMPHGHCYFWTPEILWPHAISDTIIALAYISIPLSLISLYRKRSDLKFVWIMVLFAIFIFGCGLTHIMDVINIWEPFYVLDNYVRGLTAVASIGTALVLYNLTPKILKIPTVEQWEKVNKELQNQIVELKEKDKTIQAFRQFETLTDTLPQLVITATKNGEAKFYNRRWVDFTGLSQETPLSEAFKKVVHPVYFNELLIQWEKSIQTESNFQINIPLKKNTDDYCWHLVKVVYLNIDSTPTWILTATDIDQQQQYHNELEEKNRQLVLINNDLDNFVYTASHDLKAPILNFEGLLNALKKENKGKETESEQVLFSLMYKTLERFQRTINELTTISKLQKEEDDVNEKINFEDVLNEMLSDFDYLIKETNASVETSIQYPHISFSKKNIRSIFYNLISNSLKYRSLNIPPQIKVSTFMEGNFIVLLLEDNGLGFDTANNKVFGMFKRFHDHVEGSGIGLYIVKKIMDNSGGKIEVESEINKGTKFKLYFYNK